MAISSNKGDAATETPIAGESLRERLMEHRIGAVKDAAARSRTTWLFSMTVAFIFATVLFNALGSFNQDQLTRRAQLLALLSHSSTNMDELLNIQEKRSLRAPLKEGRGPLGYLKELMPTNSSDTNTLGYLKNAAENELKQYAGRQFEFDNFNLPFLGVSVSSADLGTVGGFALIIVGLWLLATLRRTNHAYGLFVRRRPGRVDYQTDHNGYTLAEVSYAYNAISQHMVFTTSNRSMVNCLTLASYLVPPLLLLVNHLATAHFTFSYFRGRVVAELFVMLIAFAVWIVGFYIQAQIIETLHAWKDASISSELNSRPRDVEGRTEVSGDGEGMARKGRE